MDDLIIARALHVLAVIHWIGGATLVTLVILPAVASRSDSSELLSVFESIESRFSFQARISVTVAGATGFYMTYRLDAWDRFLDAGYWWMHAMVLVWVLFTGMLFVAEPFFLNAWLRRRARNDPAGTFARIHRAHLMLMAVSLATAGAAVLGAHGLLY